MIPKIDKIQLGSPDFWKTSNIHDTFRRLRTEHPISWTEDRNTVGHEGGFWSLVRYDDIRYVSQTPEVFSSQFGINSRREDEPETGMLTMDDPEHLKLRTILTGRFSAKQVADTRTRIEHSVTAILDRCLELKEFDFMAEVAKVLPPNLILDLLDCPEELRPEMVRLTDEVFTPDPLTSAAADRRIAEIGEKLGEERRGRDGDDLLTIVANGQIEGRPLATDEIGHYFGLLATGGLETTGTVLGQGMRALEVNPDERDRWKADFEGMRTTAIEELVRWVTPIRRFSRTALVDAEIAGQHIAAGDVVCMWYTSANRDEHVFVNPDTLNLSRHPNPHVSFGAGGPHFCLGANLARLELGIFFREFFARCSEIELGEPVFTQNSFVNNLVGLPCRIQAR